MSMKKRLISMVTALVIAVSNTSFLMSVTASEITVDEKIDYLLSQGFSEEFLENKEESDVNEIYNMFYGETVRFLGTETVELNETNSSMSIEPTGVISESDMVLKITKVESVKYDTATNNYTLNELQVFIDYEWAQYKPLMNIGDAVAVNWDSDLFTFKSGTFHSSDYKVIENSNIWHEMYSNDNPAEINQSGLGYAVPLDAMFWGVSRITAQKGTAYFSLLPKKTMYTISSDHITSINVNYVHNITPTTSLSFTAGPFGVSINVPDDADSVAKSLNYYYG